MVDFEKYFMQILNKIDDMDRSQRNENQKLQSRMEELENKVEKLAVI
jgi:predicted ribonuclease toxin of YeeF-YezG toxin-antitoxin module